MPKQESQTIDSQIRSRIYGHGRGWAFTPKHFRDLGSTAATDSCLRRLKAAGTTFDELMAAAADFKTTFNATAF